MHGPLRDGPASSSGTRERRALAGGASGRALPPPSLHVLTTPRGASSGNKGVSVLAVAVGAYHVCALLAPGPSSNLTRVKCFGDNDVGQLGLGDTENRGDEPGEMGAALPAVDLGSGLNATALAAGNDFTCALLQPGGLVKCWGASLNRKGNELASGMLGQGDNATRGDLPGWMGTELKPVDLGPGLQATAISVGWEHACALLQPGGLVKCWGYNIWGILGQEDNETRGDRPGTMGAALKPVDLGPGLTATAVSAGNTLTCVILQPGGLVKCWGLNVDGQLGQGDTANRGDRPGTMGAALRPVDLGPGLTATQVSAGESHACALLQPGGLVKCWGEGEYGELGHGDIVNRGDRPGTMGAALKPIDLGSGLTATHVASADAYNCAVLQPGGLVKCWGRSFFGSLGLGQPDDRRGDDPGEMGAALPAVDLGPGLNATDVEACNDTTCVLLQPGGLLKCWGRNQFGKLGTGDTDHRGAQSGQMGSALGPMDLGPA